MHIAVCDDNVADRKQLERLLKRESDRRASSTGIFYADSFGNAAALLANPMQYDVFYIDICRTPGLTGSDVAAALAEKGTAAPVFMCCSEIDYRRQAFPENVFFLDKPVSAQALSESLDQALRMKENAVSLIELREDKDTYYVRESDILYAVKNKRLTDVFLTDGRIVSITLSPQNLLAQLEDFESFFASDSKTVLNGSYLQRLDGHRALMTDGRSFRLSHGAVKYAEWLLGQNKRAALSMEDAALFRQ